MCKDSSHLKNCKHVQSFLSLKNVLRVFRDLETFSKRIMKQLEKLWTQVD